MVHHKRLEMVCAQSAALKQLLDAVRCADRERRRILLQVRHLLIDLEMTRKQFCDTAGRAYFGALAAFCRPRLVLG